MASLMGDVPIMLRGAPDQFIGLPGSEAKSVQVMQLDMSNDVLEELLASARNGKQPQISFGRNPMLRFGSRSIALGSRPVRYLPEIYENNDEDDWEFAGHVSHALSAQKTEDPSAGLDEALAVLKNNVAMEKERAAKQTITHSNHKISSSKARLSSSLRNISNDSTDMSIGRATMDWAIKHRTPAVRHALVHILAIKSETLSECSKKAAAYKEVVKPILEKIASENDNGEWEMGNKGFKELDPWAFRYTDIQRKEIIEKAIKAFDRLRIDPKDAVWQKLLPFSERNTGKILSQLNLQVSQGTPSMRPKIIDRKTGHPKKPDPKKANDARAKDRSNGTSSPRPAKEKEAIKPSRSDSPLLKASTKNKVAKSSKLGMSPVQRPIKEVKPSSSAKSLLNKPRNPSPLSKSPPVNASDFEDNHPVHKAFSAAPSPSKSGSAGNIKRKAQESDRHREPIAKKARVDNLLSVSKASKPSSSLKRKQEDTSSSSLDSAPLKLRKLANSSADMSRARSTSSKTALPSASKSSNRPRSSTQVSDDSSVTSPDYVTSHSKRLELAEEFQRFYGKYKRFHMELSGRSEPPSRDQLKKLMEMDTRVREMKKQLAAS